MYADADVFVLPSGYENFGMVAAEAAAAGAAIVLTDRCGVAECFAGRGAIVVPYGEAQLREALERLLADPALRRKLGDEAREVAEEWSWPRVVELQEERLPPSARLCSRTCVTSRSSRRTPGSAAAGAR